MWPVEEVEEYWHALAPPYAELFSTGPRRARPRPISPMSRASVPSCSRTRSRKAKSTSPTTPPSGKWDGIRVQTGCAPEAIRGSIRARATISRRPSPELPEALPVDAVLRRRVAGAGVSPKAANPAARRVSMRCSSDWGRKTVSAKMLREYPAFVRLYDVLLLEGTDWREHPWKSRRATLEGLMPRLPASHFDLSALVEADEFRRAGRDPRNPRATRQSKA